jgi:hypothetical protein
VLLGWQAAVVRQGNFLYQKCHLRSLFMGMTLSNLKLRRSSVQGNQNCIQDGFIVFAAKAFALFWQVNPDHTEHVGAGGFEV